MRTAGGRPPARSRPAAPEHSQILFCVTFGVLVVVFAGLASTPMAQSHLHGPLSRLLAQISGVVLGPLGIVWVEGATVGFRTFSVEIVEACDGVLPAAIFVAAILAFPSSIRAKARGIGLGVPAILLLNVGRIVSLALLGAWRPTLFEKVHIYVWQAVVILFAMALWVLWAGTVAERRIPDRL